MPAASRARARPGRARPAARSSVGVELEHLDARRLVGLIAVDADDDRRRRCRRRAAPCRPNPESGAGCSRSRWRPACRRARRSAPAGRARPLRCRWSASRCDTSPRTDRRCWPRPTRDAMICCVRSAMRAASSVGSASASSRPLVCSDCVPPSTAASACSATRTMLLSGCCAVSVLPAVCVWKRSCCARGLRGAEAVAHQPRPQPPRGAELRHLLQEVVVRVEEEREALAERVDVEPRVDRRLHVGDRVGEGERHLLHRRRARLADVIAADRDRVPLRHLALAEREDVGDDAQRRLGRIDVGAARDVLLEDVVLDRARELPRRHPLALGRPRRTAPAG